MDPFDFGHEYFYVSHGNVDDTIREMVSQLFLPFVSELRRDLRRTATVNVPASDRIVSLDHNSADYLQLSDALEKVETALREANDYPDAEDKEQRIARFRQQGDCSKHPASG
jgi:hypothetical protein